MKKLVEIYKKIVRICSRIPKRQRFLISTIITTLLFIFFTFSSFQDILVILPILLLVTYLATWFALLEGINRAEWILLFLPPLYFTFALYDYAFFLPQRWLTRLPLAAIYGVSMYATLLSQNIFNVGVEKSLQLARAAFSVNYLFLTISLYLATNVLFAMRLPFFLNGVGVFLLVLPVAIHFLWSIEPLETVEKRTMTYAAILAWIAMEIALLFSFTPLNPAVFALLITGIFYSIGGLMQAHLQERLFKERIREYLLVILGIGLIVFLSLKW